MKKPWDNNNHRMVIRHYGCQTVASLNEIYVTLCCIRRVISSREVLMPLCKSSSGLLEKYWSLMLMKGELKVPQAQKGASSLIRGTEIPSDRKTSESLACLK